MSLNSLVDSRDMRFVLFEMLGVDKLNRFDIYSSFDRDVYEDTLNLAEKISVEQFFPTYMEGDRIGLTFDPSNYTVKVPESFHKGFRSYMEAGFHTLAFPPEEWGRDAHVYSFARKSISMREYGSRHVLLFHYGYRSPPHHLW